MSESSKEETVQLKEGVVEVLSCYNSPKHSKEVWVKIRFEFEAGTYRSLKELASKYGVNFKTLQSRMNREGWKEKREAILSKVEAKVHGVVLKELSKQDLYLNRLAVRTEKYEQIITASMEQLGSKDANGTPLLDPEAIDQFTRSEARLVEMNRVAYRIPTMSSQEVTSGGMDLGTSFVQAVAKLRGDVSQPRLSGEDLSKVLEAEVE